MAFKDYKKHCLNMLERHKQTNSIGLAYNMAQNLRAAALAENRIQYTELNHDWASIENFIVGA